ncbi:amidohydrolase family protein [Cypionkella sp.]|uniref:amidohydrolase family protein n=1 Tax=Cypionkella sp. TaxID=2811411 RepID=UPI00261A0D95|nr:amidohydrolase family protein [Cypionkella sp.]MDB5667031.1 nagA [Cypionkella sp.]
MTDAAHILFRGVVVLPEQVMQDGYVACSQGKIVAVGEGKTPAVYARFSSVTADIIAPGFIDIHVHGAANADYMDGTLDAVKTVNRAHATHGTTAIFPTTTTGSFEELDAMVTSCETVKKNWTRSDGARIAGIHFYGPYFAEDKVGCHDAAGRRDPVKSEYEYFLSKDIIKIATCAAELVGALDFYKFARDNDCYITCGHSNASWEELEAAFDVGVRHVDHFWCAMSSVVSLRKRFGMPMQAGMEQFVLMNREMTTEVIADGQHLTDPLLEFAARMIGSDRLCLVTDANRAMDCPPGEYRFGHRETGALVFSDGVKVTGEDGGLASSMCGMDHMVRTMASGSKSTLNEVIAMASLTPAKLTGIDETHGSLAVGKTADINLLSGDLRLEGTYIAGQKI